MAFTEGESSVELFRDAVRNWITGGLSGNQMLQSARELGFGINRQAALGIIRDAREAQRIANEAAGAAIEITPFLPEREFKWGVLTHDTEQFLRFDGPKALLFQVGSEAGPGWTDYTILPEDVEATAVRIVTEEDEPSDPNDTRNGPYYHTSQPYPGSVHPSEVVRRLGKDPGRVVRVIFDLP